MTNLVAALWGTTNEDGNMRHAACALLALRAGLCLISSTSIAQPIEDWQTFARTNDASTLSFSPSRTLRNGPIVATWVTDTKVKPIPMGSGAPVSKMVSRVEVDCSGGTTHYTTTVFYSESGETLGTANNQQPALPTIPGSTGEMLFYRLCGQQPLTPQRDLDAERAQCANESMAFFAPLKANLNATPLPQPQAVGGIVARASPFEGMARIVQMQNLNDQEQQMTTNCVAAKNPRR